MRRLGMAVRSEDAYVGSIRRFVLAHGKHYPRELVERKVDVFLTDPAVRGQVAASMQDQALLGWLFLYRRLKPRAWQPSGFYALARRARGRTVPADSTSSRHWC
ncbi:MAG: phage integrase N-terminal SAM-like domain-containing protein [Lysobacterales bacterium]